MIECWLSSSSRREGLRNAGAVDVQVGMRRSCEEVEGVVRVAAFRAGDRRLMFSIEASASELLALAERLRAVAAGGLVDEARRGGGA